MKRAEAAKLIKKHLERYCARLEQEGPQARLRIYSGTCPLCLASGNNCHICVDWPINIDAGYCLGFKKYVNSLENTQGKLVWINKLIVALDEWVEEES